MMTSLVTENDVGICRYLNSDNKGFKGRIKERYSDFNVTEIGLDGHQVSLVSQNDPKEETEKEQNKVPDVYEDLSEEVKKLISVQDFQNILKVVKGESDKHDINVEKMSKADRKAIHDICKIFNLESNTQTSSSGEKMIEMKKPSADKKVQNRGGINHGERGRSKAEKFLHFSLYKENMGTSELISQLAHSLRTKDKYFSFAGTKDRRGRTLQRVAVSLIKPESIEKAVARFKTEVAVGNYTYHPQGLRLGDLSGNHFEIAIKDVDTEGTRIDQIMNYFKENGFINYFGMQRFGTSEVPTHQIGLKILKRDLNGAVDLILLPREHQSAELKIALTSYAETKDAESAFKSLPYKMKNRIEAKLLNGIKSHHENDKVNAMKFIPSGVKQMYGHAYQSYIWNSLVSKRIEKYGTQVLEGDLVEDKSDKTYKSPGIRINVRKLKASELSDFTIYDIFLPLPGYAITLPDNEMKDFMMEMLKAEDLTLESFRSSIRDYDLPGGYRKILIKAQDVSWEVVKHKSLTDDIIHSKLELSKQTGPLREIGDAEGGMTSLIVRMSLVSSCYATMALREIMRVHTDVSSMKADVEEESEKEDQTANGEDSESSIKHQATNQDEKDANQNGEMSQNGDSKRKLEEKEGGDEEVKKQKVDA
eukprot:TRINITY_DN2834_c0_g1_i1.p1 TRINITY_DN2834_c0_g1~~TRINITY_DN2834_c0_g1_i1.p1  ORF type:complete len:648 (+),score=136.95 TRINITY_DN2834_c0_g1_i1:37-1980(+)